MPLIRRSLSLCALLLVAACGGGDSIESRLPGVDEGDTRADVLAAFGTGPLQAMGTDTLRLANGFRRQLYLLDGAQYEVIFYRTATGSLEDEIVRDTEVPVVLRADTVIARGWRAYDELASSVGLPNYVARDAAEAARMRSLAGPQTPAPAEPPPAAAPPVIADSTP